MPEGKLDIYRLLYSLPDGDALLDYFFIISTFFSIILFIDLWVVILAETYNDFPLR